MTAHLVDHALVAERLTNLRRTSTNRPDFRRNLHELSLYVLFDALRTLPTTSIEIDTPLEKTVGAHVSQPPLYAG